MLSNSIIYTLTFALGVLLFHCALVHSKETHDDVPVLKIYDDEDDGHSSMRKFFAQHSNDYLHQYPNMMLKRQLASRGVRLPSESILLGKRRLPVEAVLLGRRDLPNEGVLLGKRR